MPDTTTEAATPTEAPPTVLAQAALTTDRPIAGLGAITLDCADPAALAAFYASALGWTVVYSDADNAYIGPAESDSPTDPPAAPVRMGFQRVDGREAPAWPGPAKQFHLDLRVADIPAAEAALIALGATVPEFQPGAGRWRVLADPEGHLFCLATNI
jgi:catechol 2,3-dioxygenase-like lactoylglutathione lyase family enzyme